MSSPNLFVVGATVLWAVVGAFLAVVDLRTRRLPTRPIWATAGSVWVLYSVASIVEGTHQRLLDGLIGALLCGGLLAVVHFAHPPSMGFGDVRLSVLNGLVCGWWGWQVAVVGLAAGFMLALPEAVYTLVRYGPRDGRPLGPYLVAGSAPVVIWINAIS